MTVAGPLLLFHIKNDLENLITVNALIWENFVITCTNSFFGCFPVFHSEAEAAELLSSLCCSVPLKSNLKHESDIMVSDLKSEIVY